MTKNSQTTTQEWWWVLPIALLPQILSAFLTGVANLAPSGPPILALLLVIAQFLVLCLLIGALAYFASPEKARNSIRYVFDTQLKTLAFVVTAGLVLGVTVVTLSWYQRIVRTPDLVGLNAAQATIELAKLGLLPKKYIAPESDDFSKISHQEPAPNVEIMKGSVVSFVAGALVVKVQISDPMDQASCEHTTIIRGTSEGVAESQGRLRAGLLLHSFNADGYWVYGPLAVDAAGNWQHTVYVGQPSEVGNKYQFLVVVTQEPLKRQGSGGGSPEYQEIPAHVAISEQVVVARE